MLITSCCLEPKVKQGVDSLTPPTKQTLNLAFGDWWECFVCVFWSRQLTIKGSDGASTFVFVYILSLSYLTRNCTLSISAAITATLIDRILALMKEHWWVNTNHNTLNKFFICVHNIPLILKQICHLHSIDVAARHTDTQTLPTSTVFTGTHAWQLCQEALSRSNLLYSFICFVWKQILENWHLP